MSLGAINHPHFLVSFLEFGEVRRTAQHGASPQHSLSTFSVKYSFQGLKVSGCECRVRTVLVFARLGSQEEKCSVNAIHYQRTGTVI